MDCLATLATALWVPWLTRPDQGQSGAPGTARVDTENSVTEPAILTDGSGERPQYPLCSMESNWNPLQSPLPRWSAFRRQVQRQICPVNVRGPRSLRLRGEAPFGLGSAHLSHQYGFRDGTPWCWRCGGWSTGSRRPSRLKEKCGIPTKAEADVVYRVARGEPPRAREWNFDDVGAFRSIQQQVQATRCYPR